MPEDIPEDTGEPVFNLEENSISKLKKGIKDFLNQFYTWEWLFAIVTLGFTFGWDVSGFPPSITLACICWGITLIIFLHYFWVWSSRRKLWKSFRLAILFFIPVTNLFYSWRPILEQYRIQHAPPKQPKFVLYINHKYAPYGSSIQLSQSREIYIQVFNVGNETATKVTVYIDMPLDETNLVIEQPWQHIGEEEFITNNQIHLLKGFNSWWISDPDYMQINTHFNVTSFGIKTNIPEFSLRQMETYGFHYQGSLTNLPDDIPLPIIPCAISVSSIEAETPTVFSYSFVY
jgi:hypothetical protein